MTTLDVFVLVSLILSPISAFARSWKSFFTSAILFGIVQMASFAYLSYEKSDPGYRGWPGDIFVAVIVALPIFLFVFAIALRLAIMALRLFFGASATRETKPN
jgi:hypothetical protein